MKTTFNGTPFISLFEKLPEINEGVDKENIRVFEQYGAYCSAELRHTCVLCGKKVNIDGSISSQGHKLICIQCAYKYFEGDYSAVFEWNGVRRDKMMTLEECKKFHKNMWEFVKEQENSTYKDRYGLKATYCALNGVWLVIHCAWLFKLER